jgi:hypothetical protein
VWSQGERRREKEKERDRCLGEFILQANIDLGQDLASLRDSGKESRIVWLPFGQSKLEGLLSSHPRWRKGKQGGRAREREREREREWECHPNGFPRVGVPGLGCRPTGNVPTG